MTKLSELEAILFIVGEEGIALDEISHILAIDKEEALRLVAELEERYENDTTSALHILETEAHIVLTTKKELAPLLKRYAQGTSNTLSQAAVETLAIIAYKQPITRVEIEQIRGVQVSGAVQRLSAHNLIEEKGRVEGPGRPILRDNFLFLRLLWSQIAERITGYTRNGTFIKRRCTIRSIF